MKMKLSLPINPSLYFRQESTNENDDGLMYVEFSCVLTYKHIIGAWEERGKNVEEA